jgi:hypothetical protein
VSAPKTSNNSFSIGRQGQMWCVLAQITINKGQGVLTQITRDNFFYERIRTKIWCGLAQNTINKGKGVLAKITTNNSLALLACIDHTNS